MRDGSAILIGGTVKKLKDYQVGPKELEKGKYYIYIRPADYITPMSIGIVGPIKQVQKTQFKDAEGNVHFHAWGRLYFEDDDERVIMLLDYLS